MAKRRLTGSVEHLGNNSYRLRVTVGYNEKGNPVRRNETITAHSDRQIEKALANFISELEGEGYAELDKITLNDFIRYHWEKYAEKHLEYKTFQLYLENLNNRFIPILGRTQLKKIKVPQIINIMDNLKRLDGKKGALSRSTEKNILASIQSVFNLAVNWRILKENPAAHIRISKDKREEKKTYKPYDAKEIASVFENLKNEPLDMKIILMTAIITGAREGEIAALEEKHIDSENKTITFEQTITDKRKEGVYLKRSTKTDVVKVVSIPTELLEMIEAHIFEKKEDWKYVDEESSFADNRFLFCDSKGKPLRVSSFLQRWKRFIKRYNMRYIRFHDLRHSSATWLLTKKTDMKVVQERLGHKNFNTTMGIYAHVLKEVDEEAGNTFKELF